MILMQKMQYNVSNCIYIFTNFPGVTSPDPLLVSGHRMVHIIHIAYCAQLIEVFVSRTLEDADNGLVVYFSSFPVVSPKMETPDSIYVQNTLK